MLKKFIFITASLTVGWTVAMAGEPSLADQIKSIDKQLQIMRRAAQSDPEVSAATAELKVAFDKLNATIDTVVVRTNPNGKELIEKRKKLFYQYTAQQKAKGVQENSPQ